MMSPDGETEERDWLLTFGPVEVVLEQRHFSREAGMRRLHLVTRMRR